MNGNFDNDNSPLYSALLKSDPDLIDLVEEFVKRLPEKITDIRNNYAQQDYEALKKSAHDLKGTSGNFGFPLMSELAARLEDEITAGNQGDISQSIQHLDLLYQRILAGLA